MPGTLVYAPRFREVCMGPGVPSLYGGFVLLYSARVPQGIATSSQGRRISSHVVIGTARQWAA